MRRSIAGYSRFLLLSFSFRWLALYGGLPMITLMGFSFCSWMRIQFSSDSAAQVEGALAGYGAAGCSLPVQVVQRVHEAEVGKLQVAARPLLVGVLDVQVGDVVG